MVVGMLSQAFSDVEEAANPVPGSAAQAKSGPNIGDAEQNGKKHVISEPEDESKIIAGSSDTATVKPRRDRVTVGSRRYHSRLRAKQAKAYRRRLRAAQRMEDEVSQQLAAEGVEIARPSDSSGLAVNCPSAKAPPGEKRRRKRRQNKRSRASRHRTPSAPAQESSNPGDE